MITILNFFMINNFIIMISIMIMIMIIIIIMIIIMIMIIIKLCDFKWTVFAELTRFIYMPLALNQGRI